MLSFQKLDVYQRSIEFLAQRRRAAQSLPQNIAEGAGKTGRADELLDDEHHALSV